MEKRDKHISEDDRITALESLVRDLQSAVARPRESETQMRPLQESGFPFVSNNYNFGRQPLADGDAGNEDHEPWRTDRAGKLKIVGPLKHAHIYRIHNDGGNPVKIYVDGVYSPPPLQPGKTRDVEAEESIELETDLSAFPNDAGWSASGWFEFVA